MAHALLQKTTQSVRHLWFQWIKRESAEKFVPCPQTLSTEDWEKVVAAMWVTDTGKDLYGDSFRSYDSLVLKHALATTKLVEAKLILGLILSRGI